MTERKATDEAARQRKASSQDQAAAAGPLSVRDDVEDTPTAAELIEKKPEVFGGDNLDRQFETSSVTADQRAMVETGKPANKPAKIEGSKQPKVGDRVMLTTATPIGGQTDNPGLIIGFTSTTGNANIRLENLDGARGRGGADAEYGGVPYGKAQEERGNFWRWPEDFAAKK